MTEKKRLIFDSQILNSVQMCAARTDMYFEKNLRPPTPAMPLETGDLFHKMMECYYKNLKEHGTEITYSNENFEKLLETCIEVGQEHSVTLSLQPSEVEEVIYHFTKSCKFHRMDGIIVKDVESAFIVPIYDGEDLAIYYSGKIDLIANLPNLGDVVIDHKTMRRNSDPEPLSNQFTGYSFATGIKTVVINKVGFQKTLKPEQRFVRPAIFYTEHLWEQWRADTIWWGRQYAFYLETGEWPRNRTSCDKFGGCLFMPICNAATEEARDWLMKTSYVVGEAWDPTAVLKEKEKENV